MEHSMFDAALNQAIFSYVLMAVIASITAIIIRGIVYVLQASRKKQAPAATPVLVAVNPEQDEGAVVAAAIAAAVYTVLGAHRLVYIGEARRGSAWTSDVRSRHRDSHTPRV